MFSKIIKKQIELNNSITIDWLEKDWELAIIVECAEAIDSTAWKWWKSSEDDINNLKLEAIDLLHFVISYGLSTVFNKPEEINKLMWQRFAVAEQDFDYGLSVASFSPTQIIKNLLGEMLVKNKVVYSLQRFNRMVYWLFVLMISLGMNEREINSMYFAKNFLNEYRQARGYKDPKGGYLKVINGVEDNVHFLSIIYKIGPGHHMLKELAFKAMDELNSQQQCI